jgi:hypothetical protein
MSLLNRAFDLITLGPIAELSGNSRIHRHSFAARVARFPVTSDKLPDRIRQQVVTASSCLLFKAPYSVTRDATALARLARTRVAAVPRDGGGIGLLELDLLFGTVEQARRWLFASRTESPDGLLKELQRVCPKARAIVLLPTSSSALVAVNGRQERVTFNTATLSLKPLLLNVAEVTCHTLGELVGDPTIEQLCLALEFALESAVSTGGLDSIPDLRRRYAELRKQLHRKPGSADEAA